MPESAADPAGPSLPAGPPIPVLFVASTLAVGGAERVFAHLVRGLSRDRFRAEVLALRAPGPVGEELRASGVPVHAGLTGRARLDPFVLPKIRRLLRRGRFRAIYFLDHPHAVFPGVLASLGTQVAARVMPVHTTGQWGGRKSVRWPIRLVGSRLDRIIALAEAQRRYLVEEEGLPAARLTVIPNGVPLRRPDAAARRELRSAVRARLGVADDAPVVGIAAVLRPEKNHELLLRAFARVRARQPAAELWVIGDGPRRGDLVAEARRLGLPALVPDTWGPAEAGPAPCAAAVRFLGHAADARAFMAGCDLAALSSHPRVETLPLTIIEAMDAGLPVVATRVGALAEMVAEGESGLLVEPGDEEGLASALLRLLADADRRRAMGERGQAIATERYSVERMCAATERLLLEILARKPVRSPGPRAFAAPAPRIRRGRRPSPPGSARG